MFEPFRSVSQKSGRETPCFVLGLLSFLFCACLAPLAPIFGAIAIVLAATAPKSGEGRGWQFCFGVALALLGILFGIFLTALLIYALSTKDPDSIYGIYLLFSK